MAFNPNSPATGHNALTDIDAIRENMLQLRSHESGATEPENLVAGMLWTDTTNNLLKLRNEANTDWQSIWDFANNRVPDDAVATDSIADGAITAAKIADGVISSAPVSGLVPNGSFESDSNSDGIPDDWTRSLYPGGSAGFEATSPAHGAKAYKFVHPGGSGNGGGYLDSDYIEANQLVPYAVSFISWASAAGMKCIVQVRYFDSSKTELGSGSPVNLWVSVSNPASPTWNTVSFYAPATTRYVKLRLIGGYTDTNVAGTAYFDGVMMCRHIITADIADAAVSQSKLKTSTGTVTSTPSTSNVLVTLPGGEFANMPQFRSDNTAYTDCHTADFFSNKTLTASYVTYLQLGSIAGGTFTVKSRYVTASGTEHWVFLLFDTLTQRILPIWENPDHPCCGNGGDPLVVPHPFVEYWHAPLPDGMEIVLLDMASIRTLQQSGKGIAEALADFDIDMAEILPFVPRDLDGHSMLHTLPAGITVRRIKEKTAPSAAVLSARLIVDKEAKVRHYKAQVQVYIAAQMPDWRLNRWKAYYQYAKRVEAGSLAALDAVERAEYDSFLDPGETHEQCAAYVPVALAWVVDCVVAHGAAVQSVMAAMSIAEVEAVQQTLPEWPL